MSQAVRGFASSSHDDVVLLQTRDLVTSQKIPSPLAVVHRMRHSKDFNGTSTMFAQYADQLVRDGAAIDDDSKTALSDMKDSLTAETQKFLTQNHATDQDLVTSAAGRVISCNSELEPKKADDDTAVSNSAVAGSTHATCREDLAAIIVKREKACQDLDDFIAGIGQCAAPPSERAAVKAFYVTLGSLHSGENAWTQLDEQCTNFENQESEKDAECDGFQETFESGSCQVRLSVHTSCATHHSCFDTAFSEYDDIMMAVETNEDGRKVDWVAIEKLKCYIDVLISDEEADARANALTSCHEQEAGTAHLNIQYPDLPDKLECSVSAVDSYPCTDTFTTGYSGMPGLLECTSCQALPAWVVNLTPPPPTTVDGSSDGCPAVDGGGWELVRHVPAGPNWHPSDDGLAGTNVYGTPSGPNGAAAWSVQFSEKTFNQFLFVTGDCKQWLIATKDAIGGHAGDNNNEWYSNAKRPIVKSSISDEPYTAKWYDRAAYQHAHDPLLTLEDWSISRDRPGIDEGIMYMSGAYATSNHGRGMAGRGGSNVYIRNA